MGALKSSLRAKDFPWSLNKTTDICRYRYRYRFAVSVNLMCASRFVCGVKGNGNIHKRAKPSNTIAPTIIDTWTLQVNLKLSLSIPLHKYVCWQLRITFSINRHWLLGAWRDKWLLVHMETFCGNSKQLWSLALLCFFFLNLASASGTHAYSICMMTHGGSWRGHLHTYISE